MATTRKKGPLTKVGTAVKKAARTLATKTEQYVVKPVGKALGVKTKKKPAKSSASKKTGGAKSAKSGSAKKGTTKSAKKATTKGTSRGKGGI